MTDWGWVTLAFAIVYGTLVTYVTMLMRRNSRLRRPGGQG
jgi:acyl-coenzyme A synthetase/AMP-(fatty) acid ligase